MKNFNKLGTYLMTLGLLFFFVSSTQAQIGVNITSSSSCDGSTPGTATANPFNGWEPYTYQWSNGATSQTISGLGSGAYTVTVIDIDGATAIGTAVISEPITLQMNASYATCEASSDGTASVSATSGVEPLSYQWSDGQTFVVAYGLSAGDYSVTVTDANGCAAVGNVTVENSPESVWLMPTSTPTSCGSCDGTATPNAMLGTMPYTYAWSDGQTSQTATGLCAGTYSVTVTDVNGCSNSTTVVVNGSGDLNVNASVTDAGCGTSDGSATAQVSAGSGNYTYAWSNGASSQTISGLAPGTYTVTVTDTASGCQGIATATVGGGMNSDLNLSISTSDAGCAANDGSASANVSGGSAPYTYAWSNGANSQSISGLAGGVVTVTVTDASGCMDVATATINSNSSDLSVSTSSTDAGCAGNDGSASASASGGTGSYSYSWSTGAAGNSVSGLSPGTYAVTVTDGDGCTVLGTVMIGGSSDAVNVSVTGTDTGCDGMDGTATASATGGTAPYTYAWSNGGTTASVGALSAGMYIVTVTSTDGCQGLGSITIGGGGNIIVNISTSPSDCGATNGSATANVTGGSGNYSYLWGNGATTATVTGLAPGVVMVTVTDSDTGCTGMSGNTVEGEGAPSAGTISTTDPTTICAGDGNPDPLTVTLSGATGTNFEWLITDENGLILATPPGPTFDLEGAGAGKCFIYYLSYDGAISGSSIGDNLTDISGCFDLSNSIMVTRNGITPPMISTTDPTEICVDGIGDPINISIDDAGNGESFAWVITDEDLNILALPASPPFDLDGAGAGTCLIWYVGYTGSLDGAAVGSNAGDLAGCFALSNPITVVRNEVTASTISTTDPTTICAGDGIGDPINVSIDDAGIGSSSAWVITDEAGNILALPAGSPFDLDGAGPGTCLIWNLNYSGTLTGAEVGNNAADLGGCFALSNSITVVRNEAPSVNVTPENTVLCAGESVSLSSGAMGSSYSWTATAGSFDDASSATPTYTMMMPGTYTITAEVTGDNGCVSTGTATVTVVSIGASLDATPISECGATDGGLCAVASGGSNYSYAWSNGSTDECLTGLGEGSYSVTVTDMDSGCSATASMSLADDGVNIGNYVWFDNNENCTQESFESGVPFVPVTLYDVGPDGVACTGDDIEVESTSTDADGFYLFECVASGNYYIEFSALALYPDYEYTCQNTGGDDSLDSDADTDNGKTDPFNVTDGQMDDLTFDAGINPICNDVNYGGQLCEDGDQTICAGEIPEKIESCAPAGGGGANAIEYLWLCTTNAGPFDPNTWTPIPDSNSDCYQPGPVYTTKYFIRCARREGCTDYIAETNIIKIDVISCGTIVNFDATAESKNGVRLTWITNGDSDLNSYHVQRSFDGENFETIAQLQGTNTQELSLFEHMDNSPKIGQSYYRVKRIEQNGSYIYSNTDELMIKLTPEQRFSVFPNPTKDILNVSNLEKFENAVNVEIMTPAGKVIRSLVVEAGMIVTDQFDMKALPSGNYYLRVIYPSKDVEMIKVTKLD